MPRKEIEKSQSKRPLQKPASASTGFSPKSRSKKIHNRSVQRPLWDKRTHGTSSSYTSPSASDIWTRPEQSTVIKPSRKSSGVDALVKGLFIAGFAFLAIYVGLFINQEIQLSIVTPKVVPSERKADEVGKTYALPAQVIIPKVGIDLPVEKAAITNGIWEISPNGVSHLTISARPGEDGVMIMYGHNKNYILGPLRWLGKGEKIEVKASDGKRYIYTITQTMRVSPDRIDVFTKEKGETLIIYTCDGFADLERFIVIAKPEK